MVIVSTINSSLRAKISIIRCRRCAESTVDSIVSGFALFSLAIQVVQSLDYSVRRSGQCHGPQSISIDFNRGACSTRLQHTSDSGNQLSLSIALIHLNKTGSRFRVYLQLFGGSGAPSNCLQYYIEPAGWIQTFNYDDTSQFVDDRNPSYFVSCTPTHGQLKINNTTINMDCECQSSEYLTNLHTIEMRKQIFSFDETVSFDVLILFYNFAAVTRLTFGEVSIDEQTISHFGEFDEDRGE